MSLVLKAVSGPLKDQIFPLTNGLTIGRKGAGIALDDQKVSSRHARIVQRPTGMWVLEDTNSKNGLRQGINKVPLIELKDGTSFWIGDSEFRVSTLTAPKEPKAAEPEDDAEQPPVAKPKPAKKQRFWHELMGEFLDEHAKSFKDNVRPVSPLEPALILDFVRGSQTSSKWVLGFGPRKVGAASVDLPIWEPGAPAVCFEVLPSADGLLFKTAHPDIVLLNGESVDSQVLRMGDTIRILDTTIEVDFAE